MPRKGVIMLRLLKRLAVPVIALGAFAGAASTANAESILVTPGFPVVTADGGAFQWDYDLRVTESATVETGDFFVIIDFAGFVGGANRQRSGWTFSAEGGSGGVVGGVNSCAGASDGGG